MPFGRYCHVELWQSIDWTARKICLIWYLTASGIRSGPYQDRKHLVLCQSHPHKVQVFHAKAFYQTLLYPLYVWSLSCQEWVIFSQHEDCSQQNDHGLCPPIEFIQVLEYLVFQYFLGATWSYIQCLSRICRSTEKYRRSVGICFHSHLLQSSLLHEVFAFQIPFHFWYCHNSLLLFSRKHLQEALQVHQ